METVEPFDHDSVELKTDFDLLTATNKMNNFDFRIFG